MTAPASDGGGAPERAVLLAGGLATRLGALGAAAPKALLSLGGTPLLEVTLRRMARAGVREVTIAVGRRAEEAIRACAGDGARFGLRAHYSVEETPLGTAGPLAVIDDLPPEVLVMNADLLTDLDLGALARFHRERGALATLAVCERTTRLAFGAVLADAGGRVVRFEEKPALRHTVNMGVYVLEREALRHVPRGAPSGLDALVAALLRAGEPVAAYPHEGRWLDVGTPSDVERAQEEWAAHAGAYLP